MRCTISINTMIVIVWMYGSYNNHVKELSNLGSEQVSSIVRTLMKFIRPRILRTVRICDLCSFRYLLDIFSHSNKSTILE